MATIPRLAQIKYRAPCYHFAPMAQESIQELLQVKQLGLAVGQGHHVHAETVLQLGHFKQLIEYYFRHFIAL